MRIVIAGGTGTAGRVIAEEARRAGHEAVTLSRHPSAAAGHLVADLLTGSGLDLALSDADAVIDASNIPTSKDTMIPPAPKSGWRIASSRSTARHFDRRANRI